MTELFQSWNSPKKSQIYFYLHLTIILVANSQRGWSATTTEIFATLTRCFFNFATKKFFLNNFRIRLQWWTTSKTWIYNSCLLIELTTFISFSKHVEFSHENVLALYFRRSCSCEWNYKCRLDWNWHSRKHNQIQLVFDLCLLNSLSKWSYQL